MSEPVGSEPVGSDPVGRDAVGAGGSVEAPGSVGAGIPDRAGSDRLGSDRLHSLRLRVAGLGALLAVLTLAACVAGLALTGALTARVAAATLAPVAVVSVVLVAGAAGWAGRLGRALRVLHRAAVAVAQPGSEVPASAAASPQLRRGPAELRDLADAIEALQVRMRLATELASRRDREALTASAGMFQLLGGLVAAEEGARGQLAAELHDTVAQSLARARALLGDGRIAEAVDLVAEAEEQTRAVMARTRPPALVDGDLAHAVTLLRDDLSLRYGLTVTLHWPARSRPLPIATAVTVYRFFQEALLNVVKHSDSDTAELRLTFRGDTLTASVADEGPGFDPAAVRPDRGRHVGLGLLAERARLAGGQLAVQSSPGGHTLLSLQLPAPGPGFGREQPPVGARSRRGGRPVDQQAVPSGRRPATGTNSFAVPAERR